MKYALLLRKLEIDNEIYYQCIRKIKGIVDDNDELTLEGNISIPEVSSDNDVSNYAFFEIDENDYNNMPEDVNNLNIFFKTADDGLDKIEGVHEKEKVKLAFYNKYHDFLIIPKFDLDKIVDDTKYYLKKNIKGQNDVIDNIMSKIYHNQMFINSDMEESELLKYKSNILIMGPHGTGKSLINDCLKKCLKPIPVISYELTGDISKDVNNILRDLILEADGNVSLAEKGIVIFDSMKETNSYFSSEGENLYIEELKNILDQKEFVSSENGEKLFNYSTITNIVMFDIDYSHEEIEDTSTFYYRVGFDRLMDIGFDPHLLYDIFNEEIIYMNEMDYDLALSILRDINISPIYKIKKVLEKNGKKVYFEKDFILKLVENGLDLDEGFQGIIRILNYLTQKKNIKEKEIRFTVKDLDNLKVGTASFDLDDNYEQEKPKDSGKKGLEVDVKNRTINGLTVMDAVNKVTNKIKGQDEQTFRIVNALYKQIMDRHKNFDTEKLRDLKTSVLIMGGTGVGKTAILEKLSTIFDIPFVRADATNYSGTGIAGNDVDDILKELMNKSHGNKKEAENGIVFIDEFDKLAVNSGSKVDIGGDVQRALLTLVEGAKIPINPSFKDNFAPYVFDTTNVIFFAGGAFEGIDKIVRKRVLKEKGVKIGFSNNTKEEINTCITTDDLSEFGINKQLAGRFPRVITLNNLNEDILLEIINSNEGFVNLNKESCQFEGVKLTLSKEFKKSLAHKAFLDKKGARSIKTIFSELLDQIDMDRVNGDIEEVILDENSLDNPKQLTYVKKKK